MRVPKLNVPKISIKALPRPGLRNIKTAIAVFLCFALYTMVGRDNVLFAAIAALICMQDNLSKSIRDGVDKVIGTVLGGAVSVLVLMLAQLHTNKALLHLCCALGVSLLIYLGVLFNKKDGIVMSCIVFLMLVSGPFVGEPFALAAEKVIDTIVGIVISVTVNKALFEPEIPVKDENEIPFDDQDLDDLMKRE